MSFRFESILRLRIRERDRAAHAVEEVARAIAIIDEKIDATRQNSMSSRKGACMRHVEILL